MRDAVRARGLRRGAGDAGRRGRAGRRPAHGPRHVLHAGRHARARLLLRLRRPARHADGPDARALRARGRQRVGRARALPRAARPGRGALRPPDRPRDRARTCARVDRHDDGARRRRHRRGPRPGAVRGRASGQAHLPGDPDRRQRRARTARLGAAARVARPRHRRPVCRDFLPQPGRPAREALPGRPRARVHLPARPPGVRVRRRAACRAAQPPVDRRRIGRGRRELAGRLSAAARRPQARQDPGRAPGHAREKVGRASVLGSASSRKDQV